MTSSRRLGTCVLTLALSGALSAQDWPRFRGPGGLGIGDAPDLPIEFTDDHVLWEHESGTGYSSPIVWRNWVFFTKLGGRENTRAIECVNALSGKSVWMCIHAYEPHPHHRFNNQASSSVAADEHGVYVAWTSGDKLVALSVDHRGDTRWETEIGSFDAQHGGGNSAVLFGDTLVVGNENRSDVSLTVGLDTATGEVKWSIDRDSTPDRTSYAAPVLFETDGHDPLLLFASTAHGLTAVDPVAGSVAWEVPLEFTARCVGVPAVSGDSIFLTAGTGGSGKEAAVVRVPAEGDPEVAYRPRRNLPYVPGAIAHGGRFYLVSDGGVASCLDAATGESLWKGRLDGTFFSSPVTNGKAIYVASREGDLMTLGMGDGCEVLARYPLGAGVYAPPAIAHGRLYVRTFERLLCLGAE